jgi:hypothetical protein
LSSTTRTWMPFSGSLSTLLLLDRVN